jgi:hypothetical protein
MDPRYKTPSAAVVDVDADEEFRDLTRFTNVLVWMLRIGAALAVLSLWSGWLQLDLLSRTFSPAEGTANDQREQMVNGAVSLLMLATFVVFGRWIVLAHRNLPAMGAQYLEFRPGWAVGWFFIPIANIWKPYQAMRSLWRSSHSVYRPEIQESTWLLPTWWTLWLISSFIGNATMRMQVSAHSVEEFVALTRMSIAQDVVRILLCIVASLLVARTWKAQAAQHDNPEEFEPSKGFADVPFSPRQ